MQTGRAVLRVVLLTMLALSGAAAAQNGTIKVNTRLVQVNVVVRGKNGPVKGLKKEDFTVLDNGKVQTIAVFSEKEAHKREQPSIAAMLAGFASNLIDVAGEVPASAAVILFDLMNTSNDGHTGDPVNNISGLNDQKDAIKQLVSCLQTIREGDRVALFTLGYRLHVVQDFTGDPNILLRAEARIKALDMAGIEVSTVEQLTAVLAPPDSSDDLGVKGIGDG